MSKKIIIAAVLVVVIIGAGAFIYFQNSNKPNYITQTAKLATIIQEVPASGSVQPPSTLDLYFTSSGKLTALNVKAGDNVNKGQILAKIDTTQLDAQLAQMQAGVDAAQAKLDQLFAGASSEDLTLSQTAVANAQSGIQNAQATDENTRQAAVDAIKDAYSKADDAIRNHVDRLFQYPGGQNPSFGAVIVSDSTQYNIVADPNTEVIINAERKNIELILQSWETATKSSIKDNLDAEIINASQDLQTTQKFLNDVAGVINSFNSDNLTNDTVYQGYRGDVLTARSSIGGAIASVTAAAGALKSSKAALDSATGALKSAQDALTLKAAPARQSDVALYQSQIDQARAAMHQVQSQIGDLTLTAPGSGIIIRTNGNIGEIATPATAVISLIPTSALQVKLNVSEDNVANIAGGQNVTMTLDALGSSQLTGKVVSIEPAGTIVGGAVYYKTTVDLNNADNRIRPDMTVNAQIETAVHQQVLVVPASALQNSGGKTTVRILVGKNAVEKNVATGIESQDGMTEIISGIGQNDQVILGTK